jgi:hypothetical protein
VYTIDHLIGYLSNLIIIILGSFCFRSKEKWIKPYVFFTAINLVILMIGDRLSMTRYYHPLINHLLSWGILAMYATLYYHLLESPRRKKWVLYLLSIQLIGLIIIYSTVEPLSINPSISYGSINVLIVINSLMVYAEMYEQEKEYYLERSPIFWLNSANFLLFFSTTLLFTVRNYIDLKFNDSNLSMFWYRIISYLYNVQYLMIFVSLFLLVRQHKQKKITHA